MHDAGGQSEWSKIVPLGTPWTGPIAEESSINIGITAKTPRVTKVSEPTPPQESSAGLGTSAEQPKKGRKTRPKTPKDVPPEEFKGDRVLARSIALMRDLLWSRECANAVAEGDAGRVYEILKVKLLLTPWQNTTENTNRSCYSRSRVQAIPNTQRIFLNSLQTLNSNPVVHFVKPH